jgi:hypothetical protein
VLVAACFRGMARPAAPRGRPRVVVPLLTATVPVGAGRRVPRPVADLVALAAAITTAALCVVLLAHVWHGTQVTWMLGWILAVVVR